MSCAFGPCADSQERGGAGCALCDNRKPLDDGARHHEAAGKFAVPDPSLKKAAKHPSQKKRHRVGPHR